MSRHELNKLETSVGQKRDENKNKTNHLILRIKT